MSTLNGQELQIFRAGNYGAKGNYTPADLQQLASDYSPTKHEAPLVIGHPKLNAPAFGWAKSLRADGDLLFATPHQVPAAFDRLVDGGAYKKRSVGLRRLPDGKLELRHIGFLGAMPPEVQGLMDATFSGENFEEIEFSSKSGDTMADQQTQQDQERNRFVDRFMKLFSSEEPKGGASAGELAAMESRLEQKFAAQLAAKDSEIAELKTNQTTFAAEHAKSSAQRRIDAAISTLKANKRWLPAFDRMGAPQVFAALAVSTTQEIEFSSGEGDKKITEKLDPVAAFERFLDGLGKIVPEGREFDGAKQGDAKIKLQEPPAGVAFDPGSQQFDVDIKARMAERSVDYLTAARQLMAEGKSSESYASASAGAV